MSKWRRRWRRLRWIVSAGLLGAAAYLLVGRASHIAAAWHLLGQLEWRWVGVAVLFEIASMVVFARMQRWLLRAGGVTVPLRTMVEITVAGNALSTTLPGGVAWAGAWVFGQLRRRGVSRSLRLWMFLVAGAVSSFALFVVLAVGVELAGPRGPVSGLRWLVLGLAAIPVVGGIVLLVRRRRPVLRARRTASAVLASWAAGRWLLRRGRGLVERVEAVRMSWVSWAEVVGLGLLNWLDDCAVLVVCLVALRVGVPWRGIFVAYGLTQIAAVFPLTPGGLGVVEGTLAALLHAYGVPLDSAVAVVIVYRIVSFWGLVPVGWAVWVALDLATAADGATTHPWAEHRHGQAPAPGQRRHRWPLPEPRPCLADGCDRGPDEEPVELVASGSGRQRAG